MLPLIGLAVLAAVGLSALAWTCCISEFPDAGVWRRRRELLMDLAEQSELEVDRTLCVARGRLEGHPFQVGVKTVRARKSTRIALWAELTLAGCPADLRLSEEDMVFGLLGGQQQTLGDPAFDAVFFIQCDHLEAAREFLSPTLKVALMRNLPALQARLEKGAVVIELPFLTPLRMESRIRELMSGYRQLAQELNGQLAGEPFDPVQRKLRIFARSSLLIWTPLLLLTFYGIAPGAPPEARLLQGGVGLVVVLTAGVYFGSRLACVGLHALYALAALVSGGVLVTGALESAELIRSNYFRLNDTKIIGFSLFWGFLTLALWSAKRYLSVLVRPTKS